MEIKRRDLILNGKLAEDWTYDAIDSRELQDGRWVIKIHLKNKKDWHGGWLWLLAEEYKITKDAYYINSKDPHLLMNLRKISFKNSYP